MNFLDNFTAFPGSAAVVESTEQKAHLRGRNHTNRVRVDKLGTAAGQGSLREGGKVARKGSSVARFKERPLARERDRLNAWACSMPGLPPGCKL